MQEQLRSVDVPAPWTNQANLYTSASNRRPMRTDKHQLGFAYMKTGGPAAGQHSPSKTASGADACALVCIDQAGQRGHCSANLQRYRIRHAINLCVVLTRSTRVRTSKYPLPPAFQHPTALSFLRKVFRVRPLWHRCHSLSPLARHQCL